MISKTLLSISMIYHKINNNNNNNNNNNKNNNNKKIKEYN